MPGLDLRCNLRNRSWIFLLLVLLVTTCFAGAQSNGPQVVKIAAPPALEALPMSIHGRSATMPVAGEGVAGFASQDVVAQWPGAYYEAAFQGDAVYFRIGAAHEILHVVVDKHTFMLDQPEPGVYEVTGLASRRHRIGIYVATESMSQPNRFGGFALSAGEKPLEVTALGRQIEFIGDSHTVGFGNTSPKHECTNDEIWSTTDNTQSFAHFTSAKLHADYEVNAISGRGVVRNYNGIPADTLPAAYPYVLFDKAQKVDEPAWHPQLIVIALGTNDFSTALHDGEKWKSRDELHADYEATYVRFLQELRARNPHAYFILWATNLANGEIAAEERRVVDQMRASGEQNIGFLEFDHLAMSGCAGHPSVADHHTISKALVRYAKAHPGIWQDK